jgi:hypothetical protein
MRTTVTMNTPASQILASKHYSPIEDIRSLGEMVHSGAEAEKMQMSLRYHEMAGSKDICKKG